MRVRLLVLVIALMLTTVSCDFDWLMLGFGPSRTGFTPETSISKDAVQSSMELKWIAANGPEEPAVANRVVYDNRYTYDAAGTTNCSGSPKTCQPLWTLNIGTPSKPAVVGGVEYIGSADHNLYAFDAAGITNCSGSPKTCQPLWTAATGGEVLWSVVANGVVYVASGFDEHKLYAFDAAGTTNCSGSPKTCAPLWTAATGPATWLTPAVADGVVYVGADKLYAFDAAGTTNCSGSPKTCAPLWTAATGAGGMWTVAADGAVYGGSND